MERRIKIEALAGVPALQVEVGSGVVATGLLLDLPRMGTTDLLRKKQATSADVLDERDS